MPRHYTRVIKRATKKKWSGHYENIDMEFANWSGATISTHHMANHRKLASNSTDLAAPTPSVVKCTRFSVNFQVALDLSSANNKNPLNFKITAYLVFVPEGWPISDTQDPTGVGAQYQQYANLIPKHPEWIMARRQITTFSSTEGAADGMFDSKEVILSSRKLKRNLNSGDSIHFVIVSEQVGNTTTSIPYTLTIIGTSTYWTATN